MLPIVESKCKKPMLLLGTFRYTQDKVLNTTIYWKCENCSCLARAIQQRWNRSGFFMTGTGPKTSDRTVPVGLPVNNRSLGVYR